MRSVARVVAGSLVALAAATLGCANEAVVKPTASSGGSDATAAGGTAGSPGGTSGSPGGAGGTSGSGTGGDAAGGFAGNGGTTTTAGGGGSQAGNGGTTSQTTTSTTSGGGEAGTPGIIVPEEPELVFEGGQLPGANGVTDFGFVPGTDDELLVLLHAGTVIHYAMGEAGDIVELGRATLTEIFFDEGCGLLSLAFDPDFESNRFIYLSRCREQTASTIARFEFDTIEDLPQTEVEILSVEAVVADEDWHRFGSMGFEPDGETMWALVGDLFLRELAQDTQSKAGKLLRFLPNREPDGAGYEPAAGNAFDDPADGDPSVYAYGLRSPWRGTRDRFGRFWIGDVGLLTTEEVNLVLSAGQNLGWDQAEGPCETDCEGVTQPLTHYGRDSDEPYVIDDPFTEPEVRRAIWVGEAYHAEQDRYYGLFDDAVIFGDFFTGWVRRLEVDDEGTLIADDLVGHLTRVTSWKTGPDGYMYLTTLGGGFYRAVQVTETK